MADYGKLNLMAEPEEASHQYVKLRQQARETFQSFLRNLNSSKLRWLEQQFERSSGNLNASSFIRICSKVFPQPNIVDCPHPEEQNFIVQLAALMLFEDIDVDQSGEADWMEFVEFVVAIAEELRIQAQGCEQNAFDFKPSNISTPYRPTVTAKAFDRVFYWPQHPTQPVVVFEEGQSSFHLHRHPTMARKRRVDGHRSDLLSAVYLPNPYEWTVTSGNDKMVCIWDGSFSPIKKWTLDHVVGAMCWCPEVSALFTADHHELRVQAMRFPDPMELRTLEKPLSFDKRLEFKSGHTKPVTAMIWLSSLQTLATASTDTTVRLFDLVQLKPTHVLSGHQRGLTCLEFIPSTQMLLSAGFDNYISMWDPCAGVRCHTLIGHECSIVGMCAVPDAEHEILSMDTSSTIKLWDTRRLACVQTVHASDPHAEKAGEIEPLEPRAITPLSRDCVLVSGRRMLVFDRDACDPALTSDTPITQIGFNTRKFEILTPVKKDIRIWCALTGELLNTHENVIDSNITALALGLGERRMFIGAEGGQINVINAASGAKLRALKPHGAEVSQIKFIPGKILTLSTVEKLINIHLDGESKKPVVLKYIDLSSVPQITYIDHDGSNVIVASTDGAGVGNSGSDVFWFTMDSAKQVSNTARSSVRHTQTMSCCKYFNRVPIIVTADAECCILFWSVQPLRAYEFFGKAELRLVSGDSAALARPSGGVSGGAPYGVSSLVILPGEEDLIYVGTDHGTVACVSVRSMVEEALGQQEEFLSQKERAGAASDSLSGLTLGGPSETQKSLDFGVLPVEWIEEGAHRGSIDQIIYYEGNPPVVFTLGTDFCVRMWAHDTGLALGTLEQGLPGGVPYQRTQPWNFPVDACERAKVDFAAIAEAMKDYVETAEEDDEDDDQPTSGKARVPAADVASQAAATPRKPRSAGSSDNGSRKGMARSNTAPNLRKNAKGIAAASGEAGHRSASKQIANRTEGRRPTVNSEWLLGPIAKHSASAGHLPVLQSGLRRAPMSVKNDVVKAACRLSAALVNL